MPKEKRSSAEPPATRRSDAELRALARKSKSKSTSSSKFFVSAASTLRGIGGLLVAAAAAVASQESLSPVYGAIPASLYHEQGLATVFVAAWTSKWLLKGWSARSVSVLIPLVAFATPVVYSYITGYSSWLGPVYGPVLTQLVSGYPVVFLSILASGLVVQGAGIGLLLDILLGAVSYAIVYIAKTLIFDYVGSNMGSSVVFSRVGLQYLVANIATVLFPSGYLVLNIPAILHLLYAETHAPLPNSLKRANEALKGVSNFEILERYESLTGYVSVVEDRASKFRLLRCDHSLLGGEWIQPPVPGVTSTVREPVFSVFVMLEAVRLIEPGKRESNEDMPLNNPEFVNGIVVEEFPAEEAPDDYWDSEVDLVREAEMKLKAEKMKAKQALKTVEDEARDAAAVAAAAEIAAAPKEKQNALVIGVGVGTAAKAMIAHGVNTTTVEIDPAVDFLASKYFGLPSKRRRIIADAKIFLKEAVARGETFDFVIHDVFTGGAVPGQLFTYETFKNIRNVLKPNGAISIQPEARLLVHTIQQVFPECRIFREMAAPTEDEVESQGFDMINMIIFCVRNDLPFGFRAPTKDDVLESEVRKAHLVPQHEILDGSLKLDKQAEILRDGNENILSAWQKKSAVAHWRVMRQVIGRHAWEMW